MERTGPTTVISPHILRDQLITRGDLEEFKQELILALARLLRDNTQRPPKKWLKSREVRAMLGISGGTLFSMRTAGILPFTKIGNIIYYDADEVNAAIGGMAKKHSEASPRSGERPLRKARGFY